MSVNVASCISDVTLVPANPDVRRVGSCDARCARIHERPIIPGRCRQRDGVLRYRHRNRVVRIARYGATVAGTHGCHPAGAWSRPDVWRCESDDVADDSRRGAGVGPGRGHRGAQAVAGSQVSGVVKDSSGGVLPGVEVTITKTDTGTVRTVITGADGAYVFPNLPVGPYRLKVALQGFNTYVQEGIVLQVNTNPTIDVAAGRGQHRRAGHGRRPTPRPSRPGRPASAR